MNENSTNEIDLLKITDSFSKSFNRIFDKFIGFLKFIKRNILYILLLFAIGGTAGYFYDKQNKKYYSDIIVSPNFQTVDFLYSQIDVINSRIEQNDEVFLNSLGITPKDKISKISVKPITDIYKLVDDNENYLELFKTMTENNDAKKIIEDYSTSKNFPLHLVTVNSGQMIAQDQLTQLMKFVNKSEFYEKSRIDILKNLENKIGRNNVTIEQINNILNKVGSNTSVNATVFYNDNQQLSDLLNHKNSLIRENHELTVHKKYLDYIVTPISYSTNILDKSGLTGKMKFIFPIIFVGAFFAFSFVRKYF